MPPRARDVGIVVGSYPTGRHNAITDVPGVLVGHCTLVQGEGRLSVGEGPVRTGVTVVLPHERGLWREPVFAGPHRLNGNGELTGLEWVRDSGMLHSPVGLTNTHSVGAVRDALVLAEAEARAGTTDFWSLPVVGETWDGVLNDVSGMHVRGEHVRRALESASDGPVAEGNVGSGTGMICHGFKGGIGTSSRVLPEEVGAYVVGVLVQANQGQRERLRVNGLPVGAQIPVDEVPSPGAFDDAARSSIIVVVATDAPLLPAQCTRLAQRAGLGVARMGGVGENFSGDLFIAFATGNERLPPNEYADDAPVTVPLEMVANRWITPFFEAVIDATEEAILNALLAAETMTGRDGITAYGLEAERLTEALEHLGHGSSGHS